MRRPAPNIGILVPLQEEFDYFVETRGGILRREQVDNDFYFHVELGCGVRAVAAYAGVAGHNRMAPYAERLANHFQVQALALIGIAGALDSDIELGDVIVGSEVVYYTANDKTVDDGDSYRTKHAPRSWQTTYPVQECLDKFKHMDRDGYNAWVKDAKSKWPREIPKKLLQRPKYHVGVIASGETVVTAKNHARELRTLNRKFLCVDQESAAVASVAASRSLPFLIMRGASDFADKRKKNLDATSGGVYRRLATRHASMLFCRLLAWPAFRESMCLERRKSRGMSKAGAPDGTGWAITLKFDVDPNTITQAHYNMIMAGIKELAKQRTVIVEIRWGSMIVRLVTTFEGYTNLRRASDTGRFTEIARADVELELDSIVDALPVEDADPAVHFEIDRVPLWALLPTMVCIGKEVQGFGRYHAIAQTYVGASVTDPRQCTVFLVDVRGILFAHSNYAPPGYHGETVKIATSETRNLPLILKNIVFRDAASVDTGIYREVLAGARCIIDRECHPIYTEGVRRLAYTRQAIR